MSILRSFWLWIILAIPQNLVAQTATPEIPVHNLSDIAMVLPRADSPTGAVIVFNPIICSQIGLACTFFKAHEHCHVHLGHQFMHGLNSMIRERDADLCAVYNTSPQAVLVTWRLFMDGASSSNWHTYGTPQDRGRRLCLFAQQAGNWLGPLPCL